MAYDEALNYLKQFDVYYEELVHFAIVLKESNIFPLREDLHKLSQVKEVGDVFDVSV